MGSKRHALRSIGIAAAVWAAALALQWLTLYASVLAAILVVLTGAVVTHGWFIGQAPLDLYPR